MSLRDIIYRFTFIPFLFEKNKTILVYTYQCDIFFIDNDLHEKICAHKISNKLIIIGIFTIKNFSAVTSHLAHTQRYHITEKVDALNPFSLL